jgi:DNA polymerase III epsilon subunit
MSELKIDLTRNIETFDLCFLDLETTGLDVITGDTICEIGIIKVRERKVVDKFTSLVNPKQSIPRESYLVHKISDSDLKDAPFFEAIIDDALAFMQNSVICVYNVEFDMGFLNYELKKMNRAPIEIPALDILALARKALKLPRYNLGAIATHFNVPGVDNLHRALADAHITYEVFFKLLDTLKDKKLERLQDFLSLFGFKNEIFKSREGPKRILMEEAISKQFALKMRYLSPNNNIETEHVRPLTLSQENNATYLLYEDSKNQNIRINFKHVLDIETT